MGAIALRRAVLEHCGTRDQCICAGLRDVRRIVSYLPKERQSMLFSATMPDDVVKLVGDMLHQPERIEVAPQGLTGGEDED